MIRLREATVLAYTKLRTRKLRLFITVFISCLLFSALAAASFIFRGVADGVENFSQEGFSNRFLISASSQGKPDFELMTNKDLIDKATMQHKDLVARKKIEAKRLGLQYEPSSEQLPYSDVEGPNGKEKSLNTEHPLVQQLLKNYKKSNPEPNMTDLKKMSEGFDANNFYASQGMSFNGPSSFALKVLKDNKEDYGQKVQQFGPDGPVAGTASFASQWQLMSKDLLTPFTLSGASTEISADGVIPVIAPYTAVEQLLNLQSLARSAAASEKLTRLEEIRKKAGGITFSVCYRNDTSSRSIDEAVQQQQELEQNKNNKQYQKPSLIYDVPDAACGEPKLARDVRTAAEKSLEAKQTEFDRIFGEAAPVAKIMKFRVIGVAPDPPDYTAFGVTQIFSSILTSTLGSGWFTPLENKQKDPALAAIFPSAEDAPSGTTAYYAQFATAEQAKKFVETKNCEPDFGSFSVGTGIPQDPFAQCAKDGKPFLLSPFGSSSLALIEIKKGFAKFFRIAAIVIAGIAAVIMMGTLGRIIADSRRETAVFRAIGAKRLDIAQIYLTYVFILALLIVALSVVIGFLLASIADNRYSESFTVAALLSYNAQDLSREIHLYAFELRDMLYIAGFTILAGLASAVLPLLSNIRRNPIRDMRDEN